jgi:uncharacterized protein YndB with AHSA1/START domain
MNQPASPEREFSLTRVFNAPRDAVFRAWTAAEGLVRWFGPKGFECIVATLDLRPGGVFHYCLRGPNGMEMWGKFVYEEVAAPERLVYVNAFSDKDGSLTRHPMSATWPLEIRNTLTLTGQAGKTTLTLRAVPVNATEVECQTFEAGFGGMAQGNAGAFAQLDAYLETL